MARPLRQPKKIQIKPQDDDRPVRNTELELFNFESNWTLMSSPSITTLSVYEEGSPGCVSLTDLYDRVALITKKNPWLTGRLKMMPRGIQLFYHNHFVDCFEAVSRKNKFTFDMSYDDVCRTVAPYAVKLGKQCIDCDEPLFKVAVLVHGDDTTKRQISIVFSVSCVIADVHTFYKLYNMMNMNVEAVSLNATRNQDYPSSIRSTLGQAEYRWMTSSTSLKFGVSLSSYKWPRAKAEVHYVDLDNWLAKSKAKERNGDVEVSTNDLLTSWFFKHCQSDFAFMKVNFRNRLLDLSDRDAGNYTESILYRTQDYETPLLIRKSLSGYRRAALLESKAVKKPHKTPLPSMLTSLKNNSSLSENWCKAYKNLRLRDSMPLMHLPIVLKYTASPFKDRMIVFKPTDGSVAMLVISHGAHIVADDDNNPRKSLLLKGK